MAESDIDLMLRVSEGDTVAFAVLMERYRPRLSGFFRSLGAAPEAAEDLLQETFIRLWGARERYRPEARFSTYLMEIARNLWLNERDRVRRRPAMAPLEGTGGAAGALELAQADARAQPEEVALARERRDRILAAVDALPERQKLVFVLSQSEGMRYREIAESLRIPEGTVKYRMHEAVHALRRALDGLLEED